MELKQMQETKIELEKKIAELLISFTKETGLMIEGANISPMRVHGQMPVTHYVVKIEVRL